MEKSEFTELLSIWLKEFLKKHFSQEYHIEVIVPKSTLSKLPHKEFKDKIKDYSCFEFQPDILGLLTNKKSGEMRLVFLNRTTSGISVREIGEMNCYCRLAAPILAFIASTAGIPDEVSKLILEENIGNRLLKYKDSKIILFKWNEEENKVEPLSIMPIEERALF